MTRAQIEERLLKAYGADQILWSKSVVNQDITDYHIDSLARFTGPRRALINLPSTFDPYAPFHRAAQDTHRVLQDASLDVHVIHEPRLKQKSAEFVASYVNFYVCNGAVIVPKFGDKQADQVAYNALSDHFPNREIVMLHTEALGALDGGIHCATQQMPAI